MFHGPLSRMSRGSASRAIAPIGATLFLVALTVVLGTVVAAGVPMETTEPAPQVVFSGTADGATVKLVHDTGEPVDVDALDVRVFVAGEPLEEQPEVPFFSTAGFAPGPTGPFNEATTDTWRAGESTSFEIAGTNDPVPEPGDPITVELYVDGSSVGSVEMTA